MAGLTIIEGSTASFKALIDKNATNSLLTTTSEENYALIVDGPGTLSIIKGDPSSTAGDNVVVIAPSISNGIKNDGSVTMQYMFGNVGRYTIKLAHLGTQSDILNADTAVTSIDKGNDDIMTILMSTNIVVAPANMLYEFQDNIDDTLLEDKGL